MCRSEQLTIKPGTLAIVALSTTGLIIMALHSTTFSLSQNNATNTSKLIVEILWSCIAIQERVALAQQFVLSSSIWVTVKTWTKLYASLGTRDSFVAKEFPSLASFATCTTSKDFTRNKSSRHQSSDCERSNSMEFPAWHPMAAFLHSISTTVKGCK